ncbi:MAG TPA: hypothetical protein VD931_10550 [Baekduia sp.]|nr:hypothetical protein [Baekduia sp.]
MPRGSLLLAALAACAVSAPPAGAAPTSFSSRFPTFHFLEPFYRRYAVGQRKPFALAEWAMWGADDAGFARWLVRRVRSHRRVRMVQYNQGDPSGPFRLGRYPRASQVLRDALASPLFVGAAR